jgi:hypothetical protein
VCRAGDNVNAFLGDFDFGRTPGTEVFEWQHEGNTRILRTRNKENGIGNNDKVSDHSPAH